MQLIVCNLFLNQSIEKRTTMVT